MKLATRDYFKMIKALEINSVCSKLWLHQANEDMAFRSHVLQSMPAVADSQGFRNRFSSSLEQRPLNLITKRNLFQLYK